VTASLAAPSDVPPQALTAKEGTAKEGTSKEGKAKEGQERKKTDFTIFVSARSSKTLPVANES
jgi:hypothetical protein